MNDNENASDGGGNDDDDSDEWGMEELVIPPTSQREDDNNNIRGIGNDIGTAAGDDDDEEGNEWAVKITQPPTSDPQQEQQQEQEDEEGHPMIIVDITQLDATIHSRFDRNSVNDAAAASALRKKIEANYHHYAKQNDNATTLIADGTVIPCGSTVWRGALVRLREERPGHYFAPIFPPKTNNNNPTNKSSSS